MIRFEFLLLRTEMFIPWLSVPAPLAMPGEVRLVLYELAALFTAATTLAKLALLILFTTLRRFSSLTFSGLLSALSFLSLCLWAM